MNPSSPPPQTTAPEVAARSAAGAVPDMHLHGRRLVVARAAWVIFFVLNLVFFGALIAAHIAVVEHPCVGTTCLITPTSAETLRRLGIGLTSYAVFSAGIPVLLVLAGAVIAALLFWRRSDDWLALVVGLFLVVYPIENFSLSPGPVLASAAAVLLNMPDIFIYYAVFLIFPDGRFVPRWTWLLLVAWVAFTWRIDWTIDVLGAQPPSWLIIVGFPVLYLSVIAAQVYRYRRASDARQRQQTKWVILGFVVALLANISIGVVLPAVIPAFREPGSLYQLVAFQIYELVTIVLPVSFAIAVLRSRLFDIDVIIRRTLIYGTLTVLLAAVYFGVVVGLQALVGTVNREASQSPVIIVASTLLIAALFDPVRRRIQATIDRRFYRRKYDATRTLATFGETLRTETDLARLSEQLVAVVQETMQPAHVSLWLRPSGGQSSLEAQRHPRVGGEGIAQ